MPKGGYKIIDMHGINIEGSATKIPGIYAAIESINGKPAMFVNCVVENTEIIDFFSVITKISSLYVIPYYFGRTGLIRYISVSSDDVVVTNSYTPAVGAGYPSETDGPSASM